MKHIVFSLIIIVLIAGSVFAAEEVQLKDEKDRISYSVGYQIGGDFRQQKVELNSEALVKGIKDAIAGSSPQMTPQEMNQTVVELKKKIVAAQQEERRKLGEKNLSEGKTYMAENGKKEGVKTTASGLQYKVIKEGGGPVPTAADKVKVHYRGTLIDGTEFDSSYKRNEPAVFTVGGVIKGWSEALKMMKVGSTWQLFIPPALAYGERGAGQVIGPNSVLIFDVELLGIEKEAEKKAE